MNSETKRYLASLTDAEEAQRTEYVARIMPTLIELCHFQDGYSAERIANESYAYADAITKKAKEEALSIREARAEKEAGKEVLIDWAREKGSEGIKRTIDQRGLGRNALIEAENEFMEAHCPEGFSNDAYMAYASGDILANNSMAGIDRDAQVELKTLQQNHPGIYQNIRLVWANYRNASAKTVAYQAVLEVDICTPTFNAVTVAKPFPATRREIR